MEGWGMRGTGGMSEQRNFGRQTVGQRSAGQWIGGEQSSPSGFIQPSTNHHTEVLSDSHATQKCPN